MAAPYLLQARHWRASINAETQIEAQTKARDEAETLTARLGSRVSISNHLGWWIADVDPGERCELLEYCEQRAYARHARANQFARECAEANKTT